MNETEKEIILKAIADRIPFKLLTLQDLLASLESFYDNAGKQGFNRAGDYVEYYRTQLPSIKTFFTLPEPGVISKAVEINKALESLSRDISMLPEEPSPEMLALKTAIDAFFSGRLTVELGTLLSALEDWEKDPKKGGFMNPYMEFLGGHGRYGKRWSTFLKEIRDAIKAAKKQIK